VKAEDIGVITPLSENVMPSKDTGLDAVVVLVALEVFKTLANAGTAAVTKAVVASAVVLFPAVWVMAVVPVGKDGVPLKVGLARAAREVSVGWT